MFIKSCSNLYTSMHVKPASPSMAKEPKLLAEFENDRVFGHDWSPDGKSLICVRGLWTTNVVIFKNFE